MSSRARIVLAALATCTPAAVAQFQIGWHTIDGGGGVSSGGAFSLSGTIGQHDAGSMASGSFALSGGFWAAAQGAVCYANCDGSTTAPILNVQDFACFLNSFAAGGAYANCDGSTATPVLNVQDFACFLNAFAAGCP